MPAFPRPSLLLWFAVAAVVSVGGVLFGADRVGVVSAAFGLVFLAAHAVATIANAAAGRMLGLGLLLLGAGAACRLWRPVDVIPKPAGVGLSGQRWVVASLDGERLNLLVMLFACTALLVAVYQLPARRGSRWPVIAAAGLALAPLAAAAIGLAEKIAGSRWPLPADPTPLFAIVLPGLLAAMLCGLSAQAAAQFAGSRLMLMAGALVLEVASVTEVMRVADLWSLTTLVLTSPGDSGIHLFAVQVWVKEPSFADRLLDPQPAAALLASLVLVGSALLALGAGQTGFNARLTERG